MLLNLLICYFFRCAIRNFTMAKPKDLYIAKSLKDLNKHTDSKCEKGRSIKIYLNFANKAFAEAEKAFKSRDEERAYILYMKYLDMVGIVRKCPEFKKDTQHYSLLLGKMNTITALENAEATSNSLKKRYDALAKKAAEAEMKQVEGKIKQNGAVEEFSHPVPDEEKVTETPEKETFGNEVNSAKLYELIYKKSKDVLILDIRSSEDFQMSHVQHSICANVPKAAIQPGTVVSKIEEGIAPSDMEMWNKRDSVDLVVLLDWTSSVKRLQDKGDPLRSLKDAIWKWNQDKILQHEPVVLEGGFSDWLEFYPQFTTNPKAKVPKANVKTLNVNSLLEFSYSDLNTNFVKPKPPPEKKEPEIKAELPTKPIPFTVNVPNSIPITIAQTNPPKQVSVSNTILKLVTPASEPVETPLPQKKKPQPMFDRSKKPSPAPAVHPSVPKPESQFKKNGESPKNEMEVVKPSPPSKVKSKDVDNDAIFSEYEQRIALMVKQKEEKENAIVEIEKKKKVAELQALEKKLKEEAEETEKRKMEAERQLAMTMRDLSKPKPITNNMEKPLVIEPPNKKDDAPINKDMSPEPIYAEVKKTKIPKETPGNNKAKQKAPKPERPTAEKPDVSIPSKSVASPVDQSKSTTVSSQHETQVKPKLSQSAPAISKPVDPIKPTTNQSTTKDVAIKQNKDQEKTVPPKPQEVKPISRKPTLSTGLNPNSDKGGFALKRSSSSPNINKLVEEESKVVSTSTMPSIPDRERKPSIRPGPSELVTALTHSLRGVYGGKGRGLCGLRNLGNSCYMNSVLQCMFNMTQLAEYILTDSYTKDLNRANKIGHGGRVAESFSVLLRAVWSSKYEYIVPSDFKSIIGTINSSFAGYTQEDSQEFLMLLLDGLHEDLNKAPQSEYKEEPDNDALDDEEAAQMAWKYHKKRNESIIVELLKGQFKATVKCLHCGKASRKFDPFMYLSLPLPNKSASIYDILKSFQRVEQMTGSDRWHCPNCKTLRDAVRSIEIWKLPPVLIIHFKRFVHTGRWRDKIHTNISYPMTQLDLTPFISGKQRRPKYNLFAVSHHQGAGLDSGHYTASCKSVLDNNWYKFDDTEVMRTSAPQGPTASILFYCCYQRHVPN
uniref:ubiquitin carboxyl-terminal hydrolase 8-like n=1 Tax=Ciona intestinalis TaxID=7719 RepID=UPI0005217D08|nr:ubiquitin carboxyl-terminal hydrolase 8-like [Ciona intestinalis]XP_026689823.1 ubiquitin carboxyl-terminal hydrolase 8-like [Ciona intestinalis]|eukprot:XP_026689822.1 ubiquitin carboxyl-terminal hydrolase 8-like [Ciona intestinalis]